MLALDRKTDESIIIGGNIKITVIKIRRTTTDRPIVRLGIEAPKEIPIHREEIQQAIDREKVAASSHE